MPPGMDAALSHILTPVGIAVFLAALILGTATVIIPGGLHGTLMALFLPLSFALDKYVAFMAMATIVGTGGFAGSMTAILLNVPGDTVNAPTCLDGHPLAKRGKAGVAIGASATSSAFGSIFGLGAVIVGLPLLAAIFVRIGPPEFFALSISAIVLIATVFTGSPLKGLVSGLLGTLLGFIGTDPTTGDVRYAFGQLELYDGFTFVPALIGLFAVPELFNLMNKNTTVSEVPPIHGVWEGFRETMRRPGLLFRSSMLGVITGLIPGIGQNLASWLSYFVAARTSKHPETFGKGNIDGVIAPEATIDVKEAATMMALFVFGIPSGFYNAMFLAEFQIFGVVTGSPLLDGDQPLIWVIIGTIAITSIMTSVMGFLFAGPMTRVTRVPVVLLVPAIYVLGVVGATVGQGSLFGVVVAVGFGLLGIAMERLGYPRPPLLVGLVLIPFAERNFQLSIQISRGTYSFFERPLTAAILAAVVLAIVLSVAGFLRRRHARRRAAPALARELATMRLENAVDVTEDVVLTEEDPAVGASPLAQAAFALFLLVPVTAFIYDSLFLERHAQRLPLAAQLIMAAVLLWIFGAYALEWRRARRGQPLVVLPRLDLRSRPIRSLGWLVAFPVLLATLGTVTSAGLFTVGFVTGFAPSELTRTRAIVGVGIAAGLMAILYGVLIRAMHIALYPGLLL